MAARRPCESCGGGRCSPHVLSETTPGYHYELFGEPRNADRILDEIEGALDPPIRFLTPYPGELGLRTATRGIASFRAIQALYQAWRLRELSRGRDDFRVLEIRAGLGRTAYFARALGMSDYTIVDIPLTNAAQGYFLGRTLGPDNVVLFDEDSRKHETRILAPASLEGMTETFDVVLNVDSFTEMSLETIEFYWRFCRSNALSLLSINHEINPHRVRELYLSRSGCAGVAFSLLDAASYVEEHVRWKHRRPRVE